MPFINPGDNSRLIYRYSDGTGDVFADPAVIWRNINNACAKQGKSFEAIASEWVKLSGKPENMTPEQVVENQKALLDYQGVLVGIAYEAFGLRPIDRQTGQGVNETFAMEVLAGFVEDREKKDESTATTPSPSTSTTGIPPTTSGSITAAPSPTPTSTDSPSTLPLPPRPGPGRPSSVPSRPSLQRRRTPPSSMP